MEGRFTERKPWTNVSSFKSALFERYPLLKSVKLDHLAIMGGSVLGLLTCFESKDLDLFVVAEHLPESARDEERLEFANIRIKQFIDDLYNFMATSNGELKKLEEEKQKTKPEFKVAENKFYNLEDFRVRRVRNVYTVETPVLGHNRSRSNDTLVIELIATPYLSVTKLLQHVDLDCTAIAYYDHHLWFSERSKFGFENLCFVVDGNRGGKTHIARVMKYFNRGFDIIMPSLDMAKIRTHNFAFKVAEVIDLPTLTIIVEQVKDKKIFVCRMDHASATEACFSSEETFADYDQSRASGLNTGVIIHKNIVSLINDAYDDLIVHGEGANYSNAFQPRPYLTDRMLVNSYESVKKAMYSENNGLNVNKLVEFFAFLKPSELIERVLGTYVAKKEASGSRTIFDAQFKNHLENVMNELIEKQIAIAKEKIVSLESRPPSKATVESKNEDKSNPQTFFGDYFNQSKRRRLD